MAITDSPNNNNTNGDSDSDSDSDDGSLLPLLPVDEQLLLAALERYEIGLELFPNDGTNLELSLFRAKTIYTALKGDFGNLVETFAQWVRKVESVKDRTPALLAIMQVTDLLSNELDDDDGKGGVVLELFGLLIDACQPKDNDVGIIIGLLKGLDYSINEFFAREQYEKVDELLGQGQKIISSLNLSNVESEDADAHKALLPLVAQFHLWGGCRADITDDKIKADKEYSRTVSIWRELETKYGEEIPLHIIELEEGDNQVSGGGDKRVRG